jgi:hypothetical protein
LKQSHLKLMFEKPELSEAEKTVLFLIPLVETAWAHGAIARREKHEIFKAAREDSIDERDPLNDTLDNLLTYQPSRVFFDECRARIAAEFTRLTVNERKALREKIISRCRAVAAAAGGNSPLDLNHHTSVEERLYLEGLETILR